MAKFVSVMPFFEFGKVVFYEKNVLNPVHG